MSFLIMSENDRSNIFFENHPSPEKFFWTPNIHLWQICRKQFAECKKKVSCPKPVKNNEGKNVICFFEKWSSGHTQCRFDSWQLCRKLSAKSPKILNMMKFFQKYCFSPKCSSGHVEWSFYKPATTNLSDKFPGKRINGRKIFSKKLFFSNECL